MKILNTHKIGNGVSLVVSIPAKEARALKLIVNRFTYGPRLDLETPRKAQTRKLQDSMWALLNRAGVLSL